jgi:hypothetical protein
MVKLAILDNDVVPHVATFWGVFLKDLLHVCVVFWMEVYNIMVMADVWRWCGSL